MHNGNTIQKEEVQGHVYYQITITTAEYKDSKFMHDFISVLKTPKPYSVVIHIPSLSTIGMLSVINTPLELLITHKVNVNKHLTWLCLCGPGLLSYKHLIANLLNKDEYSCLQNVCVHEDLNEARKGLLFANLGKPGFPEHTTKT